MGHLTPIIIVLMLNTPLFPERETELEQIIRKDGGQLVVRLLELTREAGASSHEGT